MGDSQRTNAINQQLSNVNGAAQGYNFGSNLQNFKFQYSPEDIQSALDRMFTTQSGQLQQQAAGQASGLAKNTAARMASQGITGGSLVNSQINQGQVGVGKNLIDALTSLQIGNQGLKTNAMNTANTQGLQLASARTGAQNQLFGMGGQLASALPAGTTLDDILGIINGAAGIANPLMKLFQKNGTSGTKDLGTPVTQDTYMTA